MADVEPHGARTAAFPAPRLWPFGFAAGVALSSSGSIVSWIVVAAVGAAIALVFGFLWVRDVTRESRPRPEEPEPRAARPSPPRAGADGGRATRSRASATRAAKFLEGATLGLGAVIGGARHACRCSASPSRPRSSTQDYQDIDLGPLDELPGGQW